MYIIWICVLRDTYRIIDPPSMTLWKHLVEFFLPLALYNMLYTFGPQSVERWLYIIVCVNYTYVCTSVVRKHSYRVRGPYATVLIASFYTNTLPIKHYLYILLCLTYNYSVVQMISWFLKQKIIIKKKTVSKSLTWGIYFFIYP